MKQNKLLILATILILCFIVSACSQSIVKEDSQETQIKQTEETECEPTEDPQLALDNEQMFKYLAILGLDKNCSYQLGDTFPSSVEGEKIFLISVNNITESDFAEIQNSLESNGLKTVSDITVNEDAKTKSYPYSNDENLYVEIIFSYEAEYFDVTFTPFTK